MIPSTDPQTRHVPRRDTDRPLVVFKLGGTTTGSPASEGRIRQAKRLMADTIESGRYVVPVFSAYRRGRSAAEDKVSITDLLQGCDARFRLGPGFQGQVEELRSALTAPHLALMQDLGVGDDAELTTRIRAEIDWLVETAAFCASAHESIPSMRASLVTGGERLAVQIIAAYLSRQHEEGKFPMRAEPATAQEIGLVTNDRFLDADILWSSAMENVAEVVIGHYLERGVMPVVTGFDGIHDPSREWHEITGERSRVPDPTGRLQRSFRTALGRGGSDLTATFLGAALEAEYVGFLKETPGVLSCDDLVVGDSACTLPHLDYEIATEAGNIMSRAVQPAKANGVPVRIFDPKDPDAATEIGPWELPEGLFIASRPIEAVNVTVGWTSDQPGDLVRLLSHFSDNGVNLAEVRHEKSGTELICDRGLDGIDRVVEVLADAGHEPRLRYTWYVRVVGNVTPQLGMEFNRFIERHHPTAYAVFQLGARALTATFTRNRAAVSEHEADRIRGIVKDIHDALVLPCVEGLASAAPRPARSIG